MNTYICERRPAVIAARVTQADRRLIEVAAASRGATLSAYVAQAATDAARRELLDRPGATTGASGD